MIKMRLSENRGLIAIGKKFTSPPFKKAVNGQKIEKIGDVTLMFTVAYDV